MQDFLEETMLTGVEQLVDWRICYDLLFNGALHDYGHKRRMADWSIVGCVKSGAFRLYGDYDRRFPLEGKRLSLDGEVEYITQ